MRYLLVPTELAGTDAGGDDAPRAAMGGTVMNNTVSFAPLLERLFTHRLMQQRQAGLHTAGSYRDTCKKYGHESPKE